MLVEHRLELARVDVALPARREAMHDDAVRLGEPRPHLAELAVAAHRDLVAGREQIADRRLERAATGRVNGQRRLGVPNTGRSSSIATASSRENSGVRW